MSDSLKITIKVKDAMSVHSFLKREKKDLEEELKAHVVDEKNVVYSYMDYEDKIRHLTLMRQAFQSFETCLDSTSQIQEISFLFGEMRKQKEQGSIKNLFENIDKIYKEKIVIELNKEEMEVLHFV